MKFLRKLNFLEYLKKRSPNPNSDLLKLYIYACGGRVELPELARFCGENNLQYTSDGGKLENFIGELGRDGVLVDVNNNPITCRIPKEFKMTDERERTYRELVGSEKYKI